MPTPSSSAFHQAAGGASGSGDTVGPASSTDNAAARFDGTTGKLLQNSALIIEDDGGLSTSASKALSFGTTSGDVQVRGNSAAGTIDSRSGDNSAWKDLRGARIKALDSGNTTKVIVSEAVGVGLATGRALGFSPDTNGETAADTQIERGSAAGVIKLTDCFLLPERASAPAAVANSVIVYAIDNGAGKTQLMAIFPTGAAVQLAIEP